MYCYRCVTTVSCGYSSHYKYVTDAIAGGVVTYNVTGMSQVYILVTGSVTGVSHVRCYSSAAV